MDEWLRNMFLFAVQSLNRCRCDSWFDRHTTYQTGDIVQLVNNPMATILIFILICVHNELPAIRLLLNIELSQATIRGGVMESNQQRWAAGQLVMWVHNGQSRRARVIKISLRQVKIRLIDTTDFEEYWITRDYIQAVNE